MAYTRDPRVDAYIDAPGCSGSRFRSRRTTR